MSAYGYPFTFHVKQIAILKQRDNIGGLLLKKLQQFYALKFSSDRLKKAKYNIHISLDAARANGEVITINNSELLRTLFRYKKIEFSQKEIDILLGLQKKLKKQENTLENRENLKNVIERIEKILYVEDLINIEFKHKAHYLAILKHGGFYVNDIKYVPFMATAGMIRKNTAMFINNSVKYQLLDILENGRNEDTPMVAAKYGAYFSLYCSSTLPVSFPNFAVIPDKEMETMRRVDFVTYQGVDEDDEVVEKDHLLKTNCWDGQGLITPKLAKQWSDELELDYTFSCAIVRAPFLKGLITVFDLERFSTEIAKTFSFKDMYGNVQDIRTIDLIISESMFKLANSYENTEKYVENCKRNKLGFAVAKVNPKKENSHSRTSYQFLQVLNLGNIEVADLCEPTINWFRNISGLSAENMLLYATGEAGFEPKDFRKLDTTAKAILLNPALARDRYIQDKFIKTIKKKKKESYMGSVLINSNYQFMIGDPYYQACHMFGLDCAPMLKDKEYYSEYWLNRGVAQVAAIRSPIVHHSEFNVLNLQDTPLTRKWYQHIHSGIIFPANGIGMDCAIHGGSDFDGDLICTIHNETMIKSKIPGIPIIYESQKAEKIVVDARDDKKMVEGQLNGYNSKVGFATNISSSYYTLLEEFPWGSPEHETILKRLKIGRVIQGEIIDGVKGLHVPPFRNHWTKYTKITEDMTPEEQAKWEFNNKVACQIRPSFFRFLYPHYMTRYNKEIKRYNLYSRLKFNKSFDEVIKTRRKTPEEAEMVREYKARSFFLDNNSVVNRISRYMRANTGLVSRYSSKMAEDFDYHILLSGQYKLTAENTNRMRAYLQEYKAFKRGMRRDLKNSYDSMDAFIAHLRKECALNISSNDSELADYAVEATYGKEISMVEFAWRMFPLGLLDNIIINSPGTIRFPVQSEAGEIEYLWNRYTIKEFPIGELYEK
jgi:hypothetical protein